MGKKKKHKSREAAAPEQNSPDFPMWLETVKQQYPGDGEIPDAAFKALWPDSDKGARYYLWQMYQIALIAGNLRIKEAFRLLIMAVLPPCMIEHFMSSLIDDDLPTPFSAFLHAPDSPFQRSSAWRDWNDLMGRACLDLFCRINDLQEEELRLLIAGTTWNPYNELGFFLEASKNQNQALGLLCRSNASRIAYHRESDSQFHSLELAAYSEKAPCTPLDGVKENLECALGLEVFSDGVFRPVPVDALPDNQGTRNASMALARELLASAGPVQIVVDGASGEDQLATARWLARHSGLEALEYDIACCSTIEMVNVLAIQISRLKNKCPILLIRGAEQLLDCPMDADNRRLGTKSRVIRLLEQSPISCIWLHDSPRHILDAVMDVIACRLVLETKSVKSTPSHLENLKSRLATLPQANAMPLLLQSLDAPDIRPLARENIARTMDAWLKSAGSAMDMAACRTMLEQLCSMHGKAAAAPLRLNSDYYNPALISTKPPLAEISRLVASAQSGNPVRILFQGPPGTGKTALVRHLSRTLGLPLLERGPQDFLSCMVGETEAKLAGAFAEAQAGGKMLFIDEVDSYLNRRTAQSKTWEVTQVNTFLLSMERFKGILICCTNNLDCLDPAVIRRFTLKVEFSPCSKAAVLTMLRDRFQSLPEEELAILESGAEKLRELTVSDISTVACRLAAEGTAASLLAEPILEALRQECRYRSQNRGDEKVVGFGV